MSDLNTRIANLSPGMRKILAQRLGMKDGAAARSQTIPKRASAANARLSFAQERLWFLEQFEPDSPTYHIYPAYRLKGTLDVTALERSFSEIIRRHETLRTAFVAEDGSPAQVIFEPRPMKLPAVDLSGLNADEQEAEVSRQATSEAQRPFNLSTGPLLRARLLRLSEQEHILLLTIHHLISDGWSMSVFCRELAHCYEASLQATNFSLPDLPVQYADFAEWQRNRLTGEKLEQQLAYWKRQLSGAPPALELTTDYLRPAVPGYQGATQRLMVSKELTESLKQLSQREGVTPFMLLLAAFNTLLYRYTEQDDISVGTPIAGRNLTEVEGLIGLFVNTLVLRTRLSGNPTFQELLTQIRQVTLDAYDHQDVPFEKLVDEIQPERSLSNSPLFQVMFDYQNKPSMALSLAGLTLEYIAIERPTASFDLAVTVADLAPGFRISITYKTDLFESTTISWMLRHFVALLESIVANPEKPITALALLNQEEQHCLLSEWNGQGTQALQAECVHRRFESQVERTPDTIAAICGEQYLTYKELNRRANQLAGYLQSLNVKTGVCVGLCVERSLDIVVGLLGILKAGGVYVPLDPSYPEERLTFMVQDTQMPVILTQQGQLQAAFEGVKVVSLDSDREVIAQHSAENIVAGPSAGSLAYVIYTSGSMGQPKGVLISHEMCLNHCLDCQQHFGIEPGDKVLEFASINFDVSLEQMLPGLLNGATILLRDAEVWSGAEFYGKLLDSQCTVANLPTAYWQQVVQEGVQQPESQGNYALKLMIPGGEAVQPETAHLWQRSPLKQARLLNAYGPTETTMTATTFDIPRSNAGGALKRIAIGRPLANRTFHILDSRGAVVPPGIAGELHIGGPLLAWGYLNQPALTAEKFIPDSFGSATGARLYRTGDRIRFRHDGDLEFLGRVDRQVKVRGYRIEPGEIEIALSRHPSVLANAVKVCEEARGEKRLVAYVVTHGEQPATVAELRSFLTEKVPSYMMPSAFVMLESLPLTPNGKVDYRALPAPDHSRTETDVFVGPRNSIEETLVKIWSAVLGVAGIGVHDNFFALGGDSILGLQTIARANQSGLRLTPKQLFQFQTIAELAAVSETAPAAPAEQGLVTGPVPLSAIQRWFFERELAESHHYNQSFIYDVPRNIKHEVLAQAVQHLPLHHDALRLRFQRSEAGWEQFNRGAEAVVAFESIDLSHLTDVEQRIEIRAKAAELQTGLNLEAGPLLRCALFDRGPDTSSQLLIVIHHLVVDGVSWRIILEDLQTAYEQLARGEKIRFPAKTTSFKQWMERLTEYARTSQELQREQEYWQHRQQVAAGSLPTEFDGANVTSSARVVRVMLDEEETRQLTQEVPQAYNTHINDALLAAFLMAYQKWSGAECILIDLEGHGRESLFDDLNLTRTVGWFTTIFPVLLESVETEPPEVLKTVKEHLRGIPNKGIGYGLLRYLSGVRLSEGRQAQVSFNYLGQFDQGTTAESLFQMSRDPSGPVCSPQAQRAYLVEVNAMIIRKQLQVSWTYSENIHSRETIEEWAQIYIDSLKDLICHCVSPEAGGFTPSDFPEADLSARDLEALLVELAE